MTSPKPASLSPRTKRPGDTADRIYHRLVESILAGRFSAGQALREAALARDWGVSRTPLREAVRRAAETGLVILRPNNAPLVCSLSRHDVASLYVLRENLELLALNLAWNSLFEQQAQTLQGLASRALPGSHRDWPALCLQFDRELHSWWTEACANPWLESALRRLARFLAVLQAWIGQDQDLLTEAYHEHLAIFDAIVARDPAQARLHLSRHIRHAGEHAVAALSADATP